MRSEMYWQAWRVDVFGQENVWFVKIPIGLQTFGKKRYIKSKINTFLTIGTLKKNVISWNSLYEKTLYQELIIQRNIVIKKGTSEKTRYIEKKRYIEQRYIESLLYVKI